MSGVTMRRGFVLIEYIVIVCVLTAIGAIWLTEKNDSPVEEIAEAVLKSRTGMDIDFSPDDE